MKENESLLDTQQIKRLKILCVDDDEIVLLASQAILGKHYTTKLARNGVEGLEALKLFQPDWVIVDYNMPMMDGARFMLEARLLGIQASFILLTELNVGELDWEGLSPLGLKGFLRKPFDLDKLLDIIENPQ